MSITTNSTPLEWIRAANTLLSKYSQLPGYPPAAGVSAETRCGELEHCMISAQMITPGMEPGEWATLRAYQAHRTAINADLLEGYAHPDYLAWEGRLRQNLRSMRGAVNRIHRLGLLPGDLA